MYPAVPRSQARAWSASASGPGGRSRAGEGRGDLLGLKVLSWTQ